MPLKPSQLVESPLPADLPSPAMSGGNHRAKILRLERRERDFLAQKLKDVNEYLKAHTKHISDKEDK